MQEDKNKLIKTISTLESRLKEMDIEREQLINDLKKLKHSLSELESPSLTQSSSINTQSPHNEKIALFSSLFKGREDIYPKLWTSKKTGNKGYSPVCENEWINGHIRT